jgi:hypothetical protein
MKDKTKQETDLRDKDEAAEERPVPSQAEGDLETIEEDLKHNEERRKEGNAPGAKAEQRKT